jgi:hypothetical protein
MADESSSGMGKRAIKTELKQRPCGDDEVRNRRKAHQQHDLERRRRDGPLTQNPNGAILVWDLDDTLIRTSPAESYFPRVQYRTDRFKFIFNNTALHVLKKVYVDKVEGTHNVAANILLTNNCATDYINAAIDSITTLIHVNYYGNDHGKHEELMLFDAVMPAVHFLRANPDGTEPDDNEINSKPKTLEVVSRMATELGVSLENIANRVLFFDDQIQDIKGEINLANYYIVNPIPGDAKITQFEGLYGSHHLELTGTNAMIGKSAEIIGKINAIGEASRAAARAAENAARAAEAAAAARAAENAARAAAAAPAPAPAPSISDVAAPEQAAASSTSVKPTATNIIPYYPPLRIGNTNNASMGARGGSRRRSRANGQTLRKRRL